MYVSKSLAGLLFFVASVCAHAQVEFRLAYRQQAPNSIQAKFPNDHTFLFMSLQTFIGSKDILGSTALLREGRGFVTFRISPDAAKRFNELAKANTANVDRRSFENLVGLAVIVDGQVEQVIQGVFQPLRDQTMWWTPADDRLPPKEQLEVAQAMAKKAVGAL